MKNVVGVRIIAAIIDGLLSGLVIIISSLFVIIPLIRDLILLDPDDVETELLELLIGTGVGPSLILIGLAIGLLYFVFVPWRKNGQTFGKMMFGIKAVNKNGENPNLIQHFIRAIQVWESYFLGFSLLFGLLNIEIIVSIFNTLGDRATWIMLISLIVMLATKEHLGIHDMIAGTRVVSVSKLIFEQEVVEEEWDF